MDAGQAQGRVDAGEAHRLHHLLMDLVRSSGLLQPQWTGAGQPISLSQAFALHELDTEPPLSQRDLAQRLRLEKSSVSRLAAELERAGLLTRERDPANQRWYRLRLTDRGRTLHQEMGTAFRRQYERWVAAMTPQERSALLTGLPALVRVMREVQ
jgi:DNA-binding MarR family transcriptional regulator